MTRETSRSVSCYELSDLHMTPQLALSALVNRVNLQIE